MRTIIISTYNPTNVDKRLELQSFEPLKNDLWSEISDKEETKRIIAIKVKRNPDFSNAKDLIEKLEKLDNSYSIMLYHKPFYEDIPSLNIIKSKFNCDTQKSLLDRAYYEKLIYADDVLEVFDEVWTYFSKPDPHEAPLRKLHNILKGEEQLELEDGVSVTYNNAEETHRNALSDLRDSLLV